MRLILIFLLTSSLMACKDQEIRSAQENVYKAEVALNVAGSLAIQYASLPRCPAVTAVCSEQEVVDKVVAAEKIAASSLLSAEATVRDPEATASAVQLAVASATNAVSALSTLTSQLPKLQE